MKKYSLIIAAVAALGWSSCKTSQEACKGERKEDCACPMIYDPVCGCDGKTYGNSCVAGCEGVKSFTKGECK